MAQPSHERLHGQHSTHLVWRVLCFLAGFHLTCFPRRLLPQPIEKMEKVRLSIIDNELIQARRHSCAKTNTYLIWREQIPP